MRATSLRLLLPVLGLVAGACDDSDAPFEPPPAEQEAPAAAEPDLPSLAAARWADGYLTLLDPAGASKLSPTQAYNLSGGKVTVTRPAGSTGRYLATFAGLSRAIGARTTVRVTGFGRNNAHCKAVNGVLANNKVEVRCFNSATGAPAEAGFSLVVLREANGRAFAYAHKPAAPSYSPQAKGSWNNNSTIKVTRTSPGNYLVLFNKLGPLHENHAGYAHVSAVGTGNAYCKLAEEWGGSPNLGVFVQCYSRIGVPVDSKFTVLLQRPAEHIVYAYANQPGAASYSPDPFRSFNPTGGPISVQRASTGVYYVDWRGVDPEIIDLGNIQVTALGFQEYAQCKVQALGSTIAGVRCFAPNGTLVDVAFTVLMGS